jgi:hypothetical protein
VRAYELGRDEFSHVEAGCDAAFTGNGEGRIAFEGASYGKSTVSRRGPVAMQVIGRRRDPQQHRTLGGNLGHLVD